MKILKTDCLSDGFRMPGEFEKQDGCLMIYPWRPGSWIIMRSMQEMYL